MTLEQAYFTGEIIAAMAVVISLIYLAAQIRHNSQVTRLSIREKYVNLHAAIFDILLTNPDAYRIWRLGWDSPDEMSEVDQDKFGMILYSIFHEFYIAYESSKLDPHMGGSYLAHMDRIARLPAGQRWWSRQRQYFEPGFAKLFDGKIKLAQSSRQG